MTVRSPFVPAALMAAVLLWTSSFAHADDLKSISLLAEQGQPGAALERLNSYMNVHPGDVQGQFLKGVLLAESGKSADAIKVFSDLTSKHPELPEPYNNLAVLYADQGQYEKARRALEMAIKTHPSYATAHENLGDVYARMATDAYDKALQLDKNNPRAQTKLAMVKELFTGSVRPAQVAAKTEPVAQPPVRVAPSAAPSPAPNVSEPVRPVPAAVTPPPVPPSPPVAVPEPAKPIPAPVVDAAKDGKDRGATESVRATEKPAGADGVKALEETVRNWAKAWSAKNVDGYLAFYGAGFKVPGGEKRSVWEKSRQERIKAPASIRVELSDIRVKMQDDNHATVNFRQSYRAGDVAKRTNKSLVMKKSGSKWYIEQELTDR